jgi:hypothetical protein
VTLWWGLFDQELFVEHADQRFGPFGPIDGPIPLHRYRSFRKSPADERLDRIEVLADLRNPTMEEIGYRTAVFSLEGVTGSQREYIEWMLTTWRISITGMNREVLDA